MGVFRSRLGDRVAVLHSALSDGERRDEWHRIGSGKADVVVGARSAVFAPLSNIGCIIVDEEHEGSYKHESGALRYQARDVAIARARSYQAVTILGSATPSIESYYAATQGHYAKASLLERPMGRSLPSVEPGKPARLFNVFRNCPFDSLTSSDKLMRLRFLSSLT